MYVRKLGPKNSSFLVCCSTKSWAFSGSNGYSQYVQKFRSNNSYSHQYAQLGYSIRNPTQMGHTHFCPYFDPPGGQVTHTERPWQHHWPVHNKCHRQCTYCTRIVYFTGFSLPNQGNLKGGTRPLEAILPPYRGDLLYLQIFFFLKPAEQFFQRALNLSRGLKHGCI